VYIVDTSIKIHHVEFEGRASWGITVPQGDVDEDANGHGTHYAGTVGLRKYGVAKAAKLIAAKALGSNGNGTMSDVLGETKHKGSIANMSLGGGKSNAASNDAVDRAVDSGLHIAVATGNDNGNACYFAPAGVKKAVTVGSFAVGDEKSSSANWGECIDVFAPGKLFYPRSREPAPHTSHFRPKHPFHLDRKR